MRVLTNVVLASMFTVAQAAGFAQSVSVGTPTSAQSGSITTVTIPVTVSTPPPSTTTTTASSHALLDVQAGSGDGVSGIQTINQSFQTIALPKVVLDTASGWNASANTYTIPATGVYLIISKMRLVDSTAPGIQFGQGASTQNVDGPYFTWNTTAGLRNYSVTFRMATFNKGDLVRMFSYADFGTGARVNSAEMTIEQVQ